MKCPKCFSTNTRKVWVRESDWKPGTQRCLRCGYIGDWLEFTEPPLQKAPEDE